MGTRYVNVSAEKLLGTLREAGEKLRLARGHSRQTVVGNEVVVELTPPHGRNTLRVFTTVGSGAAAARGCGQDAVRLLVGTGTEAHAFRTLWPPRKVLRTAPALSSAEAREEAFVSRLMGLVREEYGHALRAPACDACGRAMALRHDKQRRPFWGCVAYPSCDRTRSTSPADGPIAALYERI